MYEFIVLLRALAAIVITNAHYEEIYPISIIANGGLLGDVIFFAVSGFCLYNIKISFIKWYKKRILRIYPAVWIITIVYIGLGFYKANTIGEIIRLLIYPTYYHFVASIIILYVIYYIMIYIATKLDLEMIKALRMILGCVLTIHCLLYIFVYDKSYYHIDSVYEPMIRFLFLEAMLLGAIVHEKMNRHKIELKYGYIVGIVITFVIYFGFKIALTRNNTIALYQILNQAVLLLLLRFILLLTASFEEKIRVIPEKIYCCIQYLSKITLEIYLVQYALIPRLNIGIFPINFISVSVGIVLVASILHFVVGKIQILVNHCGKVICVKKMEWRK